MYRISTVVFSILVFFTVSYAQLEQAIVRNDEAVIFYNPSDTFYGHIWIQNNDEGYGGYVNPTQPQFTTLTLQSLLTCPVPCWVFISPRAEYPGYTGFDSFTYNYTYLGINSPTATVDYLFLNSDGAEKAGNTCPTKKDGAKPSGVNISKGQPVNVSNGNMWLSHMDYSLANPGEDLEVDRFYNSVIQTSGMFGYGWSTKFDERLVFINSQIVRWNRSDGKAIYFARRTVNDPYRPFSKVSESLIPNQDGTFSVKNQLGFERKFDSAGKLLQFRDRNNNVTSLTYNQSGYLTQATDTFNRNLFFSPNANGTIAQISDSIGTIAQYEYEPNSTVLKSTTYPDGSKYSYTYQTIGNKTVLTTVKDALQNILEFHEYDSNARAITSERQNGVEKYTFAYQNDFTTVTDALGNESKYYFTRGFGYERPIGKIEGVGCCGSGGSTNTVFGFDSDLNVKSKTDAIDTTTNRTTTSKFDSNRNKLEETDPLGTQKWTYNSFGQVLTYKDRVDSLNSDPAVTTVKNTYDSNGNLLTTKDALNNTTTYTYTSAGLPATVKDARNNTTTLTWDSQGRLIKIKDANNKETNFAYDARARVTSVTNAKNETTTLEYDLHNRLKKVIFPDTNFTTYTYDLAGRRTGVTDPLGHSTTYAYDSAYRMTGIVDALNHATTFGYDLMSNVTSQTDSLQNVTNFEYDSFNRLKKVKYPLPVAGGTRLEENYTFDLVGNTKTRVDTAGRTTTYDYDTSDRLIKITDPMSQMTQFEYNARSQMTKVKDALNQEYTFSYDPLGRVLSETRAGTTRTFEYDSIGNRTKRTDHAGRISHYTYDVLNRLTKIEYGTNPGDGGIAKNYAYDELSRLVSAVNEAGTVAFSYDNRNRLKTETDVFGHVIEFGYDADSRRTSLKLDGANHATYAYDIADRLTGITNSSDSTTIGFGYDNGDRLTSRTYPNSVTTTYEYDGMSRLTRLKDVNTSTTLFDRQYSYNTASQISQIVEPSLTRLFGFDNLDRLTSVTGGVTESYAFDAVGNRTSSHLSSIYTPSPFNRLIATQTANYSFDANGNTQSRSEGSNFWRNGFDYEDQVTSVSSRRQTVRYVYDAIGRRVRRHIKGSKELTKYTYDGQDVILDDDIVTGITKYQNGPGIDNKLRQTNGSATTYFVADHLGSTNGLTNTSGTLTASNNYDSFGNPTNLSFPSRYQFTGREYDSSSGLQYSRARFYDPKLGRFISEDPIGFAGGDVNLYGYVYNNPQNLTDPSGNAPILPVVYVVFEVCSTGYDIYDFASSLTDPSSDWTDVGIGGGGLLLGMVGPGGGYGAAGKGLRNHLAKGGIYRHADANGKTVRTGRTVDLKRREREHANDPRLQDYDFEPLYRTDDYDELRGLEQMVHMNNPGGPPPLNFRNPVSPRNPNRDKYRKAAEDYLCAPCKKD